jgi:hypothetical protein
MPRWSVDKDIPLLLTLVDGTGAGAAGLSPEVSIRRHRDADGTPLDNHFWTGAAFQAGAVWLPLTALDAVNNPGVYTYLFEQSGIGLEQTYLVTYRNTATIIGTDTELHVVTRDAVKVDELHKIQGLDVASPMQVSATQRTAGDVTLGIAQAGVTVTVTRQ